MLILLTAVCGILVYASFTMNLSGGPLNQVAGYVFIPMQRGINYVGRWISDKTDNLKDLKDVMEENQKLKVQVDELTSELNTIKLEQYELNNLRKLLKLDQKYPSYDKVAANVIGKDAGNWFSLFTIDKGTNDGIQIDMNVIAGSGLVGIVTDVGPNYAKVRSIIDDVSKISGMVRTTSDRCIIHGDLQEMNANQNILLTDLKDSKDKVAVGDPVVTSNISDKYLQGILIGYINTIGVDSNNLTKSGTVTPAVDFERIEEVLVILEKKRVRRERITEALMKRKITVVLIVIVCFLLQSTLFKALSIASISPNLLIIVTSSFGFMRGKKEGLMTGFFSGLCIDIFYGGTLGFYAMIYMYLGYVNGMFRKIFFPEDIKLPMILITASDFVCNLLVYLFQFLFRRKFAFPYYLTHIIIPELIYTILITVFLYFILLKINQKLEMSEKRSMSKFV
ncbi:cell shape-determining protein MreC [Lachnospiraceae bacterium]|nr:cell shape-determining protein MreC [Lachnospiraceae bacterium]